MTAAARALGFVERVGGILVAPRATIREVEARGGLSDAAVLLLVWAVVKEMPRLGRAVVGAPSLGAGTALQGVLQALGSLLPDLAAILVGAVLLSLFAAPAKRKAPGAAPSGIEGEARGPARELDLAAYAWIPQLAVRAVASLGLALADVMPPEWVMSAIDAAAIGWSVVVWTLMLLHLRRAPNGGAEVHA